MCTVFNRGLLLFLFFLIFFPFEEYLFEVKLATFEKKVFEEYLFEVKLATFEKKVLFEF